jgi:hypothetical protein
VTHSEASLMGYERLGADVGIEAATYRSGAVWSLLG